MNNNDLKRVVKFLEAEMVTDALRVFNELKPEDSIEYLIVKGKIEMKFQRWGTAMNAFLEVLKNDNTNKEALMHIQYINGILNFSNPEMFNP